ncbi:hypothetical protein KKE14_03030 [Patescibacteria group bacterium]|nr:hypothetical protein [Patescibacteria group bacterium]
MEEDNKEISHHKVELELDAKIFAALSYISVLFLVPWVVKKDDRYVNFHIRQGAALFISEVVVWFILWTIGSFLTAVIDMKAIIMMIWLYKLMWIGFAAISVYGVYYAIKGKKKAIPWLWIVSRNLKM